MKASAIPRAQFAAGALALVALWFVLCWHLSGEWSVNEQYSYGWFVPFFAAFLFWLRWGDRPEPDRRKAEGGRRNWIVIGIAVVGLVILLPVRLFEVANPDWRPLGWIHTAAVALLTALLIWTVGGWSWIKHFAFPIGFFFVAVPWISPVEQPVVQGLMRVVAAVATEAIGLFGIPAQLEGSLIRVNTGLVGVNEACSGVRSLQTSLMIGLLFGELKRLAVARRLILVLGAMALAIVANFGRAFFLVWVAATRGTAAVADWHDFAGYAIVAVVFCGSLLLTAILNRDKVGSRKEEGANEESIRSSIADGGGFFLLPTSCFLLCFFWLVAIEIGVEGWYRAHEKDLIVVGNWNVRPPEKAPGFKEIKIDEQVRQTLRFDDGREVMWKGGMSGMPVANYLFFFRWNPGSASVLRARAHRPDICLPSAGWNVIADLGTKKYSGPGDVSIAARHVSFKQTQGNAVAHTFFCLQEDKIHRSETRPDLLLPQGVQPEWSFRSRVRVVRQGIRNLGQQVLQTILISSPGMEDDAAEEKFGQIVREVVIADDQRRK